MCLSGSLERPKSWRGPLSCPCRLYVPGLVGPAVGGILVVSLCLHSKNEDAHCPRRWADGTRPRLGKNDYDTWNLAKPRRLVNSLPTVSNQQAGGGWAVKIKIGGRQVIDTASLIVPKGEDAWLEFKAGTWDVKLRLVFVDEDEGNSSWSISPAGDHAVITFTKWSSPLGLGIVEPATVGEADGRKLQFLCEGSSLGSAKKLDFQFFWGA